jgi:hypothetical protein
MKSCILSRFCVLLWNVLFVAAASAQTVITVLNNNNTGAGSLRDAVATANAIDPGEQVIIDVTFLPLFGDPVIELTGAITALRPVEIVNTNPETPVVLRMTSTDRILALIVDAPGASRLAGLRFENGRQPDVGLRQGGALYFRADSGANSATLTIEDCAFINNDIGVAADVTASHGMGGALFILNGAPSGNSLSLVVRRTLFEGNRALSGSPNPASRAARGGAVFVAGASLTMEDCVLIDNFAASGTAQYNGGGALSIESPTGIVQIRRTRFGGNQGGSGASAIWVGADSVVGPGAQVEISDSVFHHNGAPGGAAAIVGGGRSGAGSSLLLRNTTLAHNQGGEASAVQRLSGFGPLTLEHCTITRNEATATNGAAVVVFDVDTTFTLSRSVVAGNSQPAEGSAASPDIQLRGLSDNPPAFVSGGYNIVGSASGTGSINANALSTALAQAGDSYGYNASPFDPELAELADYGGGTLACPPHPTSPLVDAIPAAANLLAGDQRQVSRPQGTAADIGAVELPRIPFNQWNLQIADTNQRDPGDDPENDGLSNRIEYYFGTAPDQASAAPVRIVSDDQGYHLEMIRSAFVRPAFFTVEQVESSTTLSPAGWSPLGISPVVTPETPGSIERMRFRYPIAPGGEARRFYRVRTE